MKLVLRLALRNMIRSPGKFVFRGLVLFVLLCVVFIFISTGAGASKGMEDARGQFGMEIRLEPATGKAAGGQDGGAANGPFVTAGLADRLLESRYVTGHNYYLWAPVVSDLRLPAFQSEKIKIAPKAGETDMDANRFMLAGSSSPALDPDFAGGILKLVSGGFPRETGIGEDAGDAVISRLLAEENGLGVGSVFTVYSPDLKTKKELKVAGIFDWNGYDGSEVSFALDASRIFVSLGLAGELNCSVAPGSSADMLTCASYFLDSPGHRDEFIAEAKAKGLDPENFRLQVNDGAYIEAIAQLKRLKGLSGLIQAAALALGAVFMILSSLSLTKKGKAEMGLLRTVGAGKKDILLLYISEILITGLIALAAAIPAGASTAPAVSGAFFREQVRITEDIDRNSIIVYVMESGGASAVMQPYAGISGGGLKKAGDVIKEVEPVTGPSQGVLFLAAGFLVVLCGASAAAWKVMRHDPAAVLKGEGGGALYG